MAQCHDSHSSIIWTLKIFAKIQLFLGKNQVCLIKMKFLCLRDNVSGIHLNIPVKVWHFRLHFTSQTCLSVNKFESLTFKDVVNHSCLGENECHHPFEPKILTQNFTIIKEKLKEICTSNLGGSFVELFRQTISWPSGNAAY